MSRREVTNYLCQMKYGFCIHNAPQTLERCCYSGYRIDGSCWRYVRVRCQQTTDVVDQNYFSAIKKFLLCATLCGGSGDTTMRSPDLSSRDKGMTIFAF